MFRKSLALLMVPIAAIALVACAGAEAEDPTPTLDPVSAEKTQAAATIIAKAHSQSSKKGASSSRGSSSGGNEVSRQDRRDACDAAEFFVESHLVSPGTADHGNCQVERSGSRFTVAGHVDSQNRFGGVIRSSYIVQMTQEPGGFRLDDIQLSER